MIDIRTITDFGVPELDLYARLSEAELYHYYEPEIGLFVAESPNVIRRALEAGYEPVSFLMEERHYESVMRPMIEAWERGRDGAGEASGAEAGAALPVYLAPLDVLNQLTGFGMTRGVLAIMKRRPQRSLEEICAGKHRIAVLEEVMNPTNVGAIFRSAAALGMEAVVLTSGSSDPLYRRAARVSMGTVFQIPWTKLAPGKRGFDPGQQGTDHDRSSTGLSAELHALGFKTAAMALCDDSIDLSRPSPELEALLGEERLAVILGTEGDGLAAATIETCDYTVRIPMSAGVDSLNVAAASAVAFWEMRRR